MNYKELYKTVVAQLGELSDKELSEVKDFIQYTISIRRLIEPGDTVIVQGQRKEVAFFGIPSEIRKWLNETGNPLGILPALNENVKFIISKNLEVIFPENIEGICKPKEGVEC